jgi:hypothetical protein
VLRRAASSLVLLFLVSCGDLQVTEDTSLSGAELLMLQLDTASPSPSSESAYVRNSAETFLRVIHTDPFRTVYLEVRFPRGAVARLDGQPLDLGDSAHVTLEPVADIYGITVSPVSLEFAESAQPYATFRFATYADLSVADGSVRYPTPSAFASALAIWYEVSPDRWERVSGSGYTGSDAVTGRLQHSGRYVVAAAR